MPKCKKCGQWFLTQRKLNWHMDEEHFYFPRRTESLEEEREERDENLLISAGIPYRGVQDYEEEKVTGNDGDFGGGGASGDWDSDSDSDCCDSDCSSCGSDE